MTGPEKAAKSPANLLENPWGIASRSVALGGLLLGAAVMWFEFSFRSRWVPEFLISNTLPDPGQRMSLVWAYVGSSFAGSLAVGGTLYWMRRRGQGWALCEQWLWFLSPLLLLPLLPLVFRYKPWQNRQDDLLLVVLLGSLVAERLVFRALCEAPSAVREWWQGVLEPIPQQVRARGPLWVVLGAVVAYVLFMSFFLVRWHYKLRTHNFDLSINNNLIYGGLHGKFLQSTVVFPSDPGKYLANHAKFGTYIFLPIYALVPRPETLLVLQTVLLGASALPLFGFARRYVSEWMAALISLVFLCYYPLHSANFSEFQNVPIAAFFILLLVWAAEYERWWVCGLSAAAAVLLREDVPIGVAIIGAYFLLTGYRPRAGLALLVGSLAYFVYLRFYLMDEAGEWWYPNMYKTLWAEGEKGYRSVIKTLLTNPLFVWSKIVIERKLIYLLHLLLPVAFLPARRWYLWVAFLPGLLLTLLVTDYDPPTLYSFHYVMHWAPYLFLATPLALAAIKRESLLGVPRMHAAAATMVCASLVLTYNYGAFSRRPNSFKAGYSYLEFTISDAEIARFAQLESLMVMIPKDASVAATETIGPHLSSRVNMYAMRTGPHGAEYLIASGKELKLSHTKQTLTAALQNGEYGVLKRVGEFALLKRGLDPSQNAQLMADWQL
ncbi:MAG TPA: DUF2079 domain-containing protein [Polyangiaceae bacterium]